jgi:hypothetical protein
VNRRLFSQVREKKGLSYDANFQVRVNGMGVTGLLFVCVSCVCVFVCFCVKGLNEIIAKSSQVSFFIFTRYGVDHDRMHLCCC